MNDITITIIGMIAAFLTAFLAEPVKNYIQHKLKLKNLRNALYKEIVANYILLTSWDEENSIWDENKKAIISSLITFAKKSVRVEGYNHILQNDVMAFYELPKSESMTFNRLHDTLNLFMETPNIQVLTLEQTTEQAIEPELLHAHFQAITQIFIKTIIAAIETEALDKRMLKKLMSKDTFDELIKSGNNKQNLNSYKDSSTIK